DDWAFAVFCEKAVMNAINKTISKLAIFFVLYQKLFLMIIIFSIIMIFLKM
mgnify:CR=1